MDLVNSLKERFFDRASPKTMQSRLFWNTADLLYKTPVARPKWKADSVSLGYFLNQTKQAYMKTRPVTWASLLFPSELIHAGKLTPFYPELAAAVAASVSMAPRFLETASLEGFSSDVCSFHRTITGSFIEGFMPEPSMLASVNYMCDSAPLSFQFIANMSGTEHITLEAPFRKSPKSVSALADQIERSAFELSKAADMSFAEYTDNLKECIELSNSAREFVLKLEDKRMEFPYALDGRDAMGHINMMCSSMGHYSAVEFYETLVGEMEMRAEADSLGQVVQQRKKLLWLHLKPFYESSLFDILKKSGGRIVCEEYNRCYWNEMNGDNPFESLAEKVAGHFCIGPLSRRIEFVKRLAEKNCVDGIIHFNHWGCRQSVGGASILKAALKSEGFQILILDGECIDEREYQEGQLSTRIEAFIESL